MSLAIDVEHIDEVLLPDGWHTVGRGSFALDAYEFIEDGVLSHGGGNSGVCATGFVFKEVEGSYLRGPLTAIRAVRSY